MPSTPTRWAAKSAAAIIRRKVGAVARGNSSVHKAKRSYMDEGWRVFEYAISAQENFEKAEGVKKNEIYLKRYYRTRNLRWKSNR